MGKIKTVATKAGTAKNLGVLKGSISKHYKKKGRKGKEIEVLYVKADSSGRHYGQSSLSPTKFILAPKEVSRADGNLEKDSPPATPRTGPPNKFTMPKPYEFGRALQFDFQDDKKLYDDFKAKGKWPIPLMFPCIKDLEELKVLEEIKSLLVSSGLGIIFREDPGSYHELTMEFLSSFVPVYAPGEDEEKQEIECWRFAMGGYNWEVDAEVLCDWFRMPRDGEIPDIDDKSIAEFWKRISGREYKKGKQHKSTSIREPIWKIIHKFIGGIVFVRTSYGRLVSKMDLMVMIMMERKMKIDWLWCVSRGIKDDQNDVSKNQGLGGGSFVTIIAKKLNFTFEGVESDKIDLTLKQMKARHILGKGNKWKHMDDGSSGEDDETEDDVDAPATSRAASRSSSIPPTRNDEANSGEDSEA